jgi:hypothetical protein
MTSYLTHEANKAHLADLRRWTTEHPRLEKPRLRRLATVLRQLPSQWPARAI